MSLKRQCALLGIYLTGSALISSSAYAQSVSPADQESTPSPRQVPAREQSPDGDAQLKESVDGLNPQDSLDAGSAAEGTAANTTQGGVSVSAEPQLSEADSAALMTAQRTPAEEPASESQPQQMSAEERASLDELLLDEGTAALDAYKLDIYGFADFSFSDQVGKNGFTRPNSSMAIGNLNLYLSGDLGDNWSTLIEVRFTYLPNGSTMVDSTGNTYRYSGTVADYTDIGRPTEVGGIGIERAWLDYSAHPLLNIKLGHFLTPYGIWNVDHGSPVIISVRRPYVVGESMLPESQTGVQIHGSQVTGNIEYGYRLTLSNGRGPLDKYQDLDSNKALGGRLYLRALGDFGELQVGASGYAGKYTDSGEEFRAKPDGSFEIIYPITSQYNEASLAGDVKYTNGGFLIQGEVINRDVAYVEPRPANLFGGSAADFRSFGAYGITGYRFEYLGIMPFFGGEYYNSGNGGLGKSRALWTGINMRPTPRVVLKAAFTHAKTDGPFEAFNSLDLQAAWSF